MIPSLMSDSGTGRHPSVTPHALVVRYKKGRPSGPQVNLGRLQCLFTAPLFPLGHQNGVADLRQLDVAGAGPDGSVQGLLRENG